MCLALNYYFNAIAYQAGQHIVHKCQKPRNDKTKYHYLANENYCFRKQSKLTFAFQFYETSQLDFKLDSFLQAIRLKFLHPESELPDFALQVMHMLRSDNIIDAQMLVCFTKPMASFPIYMIVLPFQVWNCTNTIHHYTHFY